MLSILSASAHKLPLDIQLVTPFPAEHYGQLWAWLNQEPSANFDDSSPKTLEEFSASMETRQKSQMIYEVVQHGQPIGVIGIEHFTHVTPQAKFVGICFTKEACGKGIALEAVKMVLQKTFSGGAQSVVAMYHSDNIAVSKMFRKLGVALGDRKRRPLACEVARFPNPATRDGKPVEMTMVLIDGNAFRALYGYVPDKVGSVPSSGVPVSA